MINRMEDPTSGQILLNGVDTSAIEVRELRRRVGMVFQTPALLEGSVAENICYGPQLKGRSCNAAEYLRLVGLEPDLLSRPATALSVGQQQRVAIARALANEPGILLLDEPTSALDQTASRNILELIQRLNKELGLTVLLVTHVLEHAKAVGTQVVLLASGQKAEEGRASDFFAAPQSETGRLFLRGELTSDAS
jgi:putative ABC transport system ATP-binding protein